LFGSPEKKEKKLSKAELQKEQAESKESTKQKQTNFYLMYFGILFKATTHWSSLDIT